MRSLSPLVHVTVVRFLVTEVPRKQLAVADLFFLVSTGPLYRLPYKVLVSYATKSQSDVYNCLLPRFALRPFCAVTLFSVVASENEMFLVCSFYLTTNICHKTTCDVLQFDQ